MRTEIMIRTMVVPDDQWTPIGKGYEKFEEDGYVYVRRAVDKKFTAVGDHESLGALFMYAALDASDRVKAQKEAFHAVGEDRKRCS